MPLKGRRLWLSCLILTAAGAGAATAQQQAENSTPLNGVAATPTTTAAPTNTIPQRIARIRAWIAGRNFGAAAHELEKIKKETAADESMQQVSRVMLMGVYLEQPDYNRAQALLEETFKRKSSKRGAEDSYYAVAGQIIKSSQSQLERYKSLGINISDSALPNEAANDLGKWHSLLENIVQHSKQMSVELKRPDEALSLLEAATSARSTLARDEYEAAKWKNEVIDTRELIANAQMKVSEVDASTATPSGTLIASTNLAVPTVFKQTEAPKVVLPPPVENKPIEQPQVASGNSEVLNQPVQQPAPVQPTPVKTENTVAEKKPETVTNNAPQNNSEPVRQRIAPNNNAAEKAANQPATTAKDEKNAASGDMMQIGSLVDMATRKVNPNYPPFARTARVSGVVKVEVVVDENGNVAEVRNAAGPEMLRRAAMDAVKRWQFKPATRDGQPVRASGFVNFNFTL
ncbi:MAG: TonB family protein [Acidobacteriota bacterium]|nr:TonB family protein [Acidobacteriota bacterium]